MPHCPPAGCCIGVSFYSFISATGTAIFLFTTPNIHPLKIKILQLFQNKKRKAKPTKFASVWGRTKNISVKAGSMVILVSQHASDWRSD
jgi:hypothetical protein